MVLYSGALLFYLILAGLGAAVVAPLNAFTVVFIICVVFGGIGAAIAWSRGKSVVPWFLLCAVLPVIGIIIVLLSTDEREEAALHQRRGQIAGYGNWKKCPECAEIVKREAKICKHCQYRFAS